MIDKKHQVLLTLYAKTRIAQSILTTHLKIKISHVLTQTDPHPKDVNSFPFQYHPLLLFKFDNQVILLISLIKMEKPSHIQIMHF